MPDVETPPAHRLVVFARAPRPGAVKRRLAVALGDAGACTAYSTLARHVLGRLGGLPSGELRHTPDDAAPELAGWLPPGWHLAPQCGGDLGGRMARAFTEHFLRGADRVVIVGSDCPEVAAEDIRDAWRALAKHDVVLGPAADGGYWLIGRRAGGPGAEGLFTEMPWGTARVLAETRRRAAAAGLHTALLRQLADVDEPADWDAWRGRTGGAPMPAPPGGQRTEDRPPGPAR